MVIIPPGVLITTPILKKKLPSGKTLGETIVEKGLSETQPTQDTVSTVRRRVTTTGGSGVGPPPQAPTQAQVEQRQQREAEERRLIEETRRIGEERLARLEREQQAKEVAAQLEQARIEQERQRLISAGGTVTTKTSIDVKTGDQLIITETTNGGRTIRDIENIETGEKKTTTFAPGRGGGGVRQTGGIKTQKPPVEAPVEPEKDVSMVVGEDFIGPIEITAEQREKFRRERLFTVEAKRPTRDITFTEPLFGTIITDPVTGKPITGEKTITIEDTRITLEDILDLPGKGVEILTGKKPREAFRFITGAEQTDITESLTLGEILGETLTVPQKAIVEIGGALVGRGARTIRESSLFPEKIIITTAPTPERTFTEPLFGTIITDPVTGQQITERTIIIPARGERKTEIFAPERIEEGVRSGFGLGAIFAAPLVFAPGFVAEGTTTALDKDQTAINRLLGGAEAFLGATIIGGRAVQFLKTPVVKTTPTRPIKTPQAVEVQKLIQVGDKQTTASVFQITGELRPPTIIERTTRGREILNFLAKQTEDVFQVGGKPTVSLQRPGKITFREARPFTIRTPATVIGEEAFLVSEVRGAGRISRLGRISGTGKEFSLKEFRQLPKTEQFLLQRRAEALAGRKVSLKQVPKILSEDSQRFSSFIEAEDLLKVKIGRGEAELKLIPRGRRIKKAVGVTESEKLLTGEGFDLVKAKTIFKDVTVPFSRRAGKTPELDTLLLRLKPKPDKGDGIKLISPAKIKKTPFLKTITEQDILTQSAVSKVVLPSPKVAKPTRTVLDAPVRGEVLPSMVGGLGGLASESIFTGTAEFEITEPTRTGISRPSIRQESIPSVSLDTRPSQALAIIEIQKEIQRGRGLQKLIQRPKAIETQKEIQKITQREKVAQLQKSIELQKPSQISNLLLRTPGFRAPPRLGTRPTRRIRLRIPFGIRRKPGAPIVREVELFSVELRRGGEFGAIGRGLTREEAITLGIGETRRTLARTFRIRRTGRKKQVGGIDEEFAMPDITGFRTFRRRKGKKVEEPFTFIQEAPLALGTRAETIEIQRLRREQNQLNKLIGI